MKHLKNFKSYNENFIQRGMQAVGDMAKKAVNWLQSVFLHPLMKVINIPGGKKAVYEEDGKVVAAVYDFTGGVSENKKNRRNKKLNESFNKKNKRGKLARKRSLTRKINEVQVPLEFEGDQVPNVNRQELMMMIDVSFENKAPLFIWGAPGIGKTEIVESYCKENDLTLIFFNVSIKEPMDFIGVPSVDQETQMTRQNLPAVWPRDNGANNKGGIIFFDEMNTASIPVLNASLQIVQSRRLDDYVMPEKWVIFAAGNRMAEADVTPLSGPLSGRFKHVNFVPKFEEWEEWGQASGKVHPAIMRFVKARTSKYFHNYDPDAQAEEVKLYASPRNWTRASKALFTLENKYKNPSMTMIQTMVASNVGNVIAREFAEFYKIIQSISIDDIKLIYTDPDKAPLPPKVDNGSYRVDVAYAMMMMAAEHKKDGSLTVEELMNAVDYAERLNEFELAYMFFKILMGFNVHLYNEEETMQAMKKFKHIYNREMAIPKGAMDKKTKS